MMRDADLIASAASALRANPLRSALTALGVIIGVASVVTMGALGAGARAQIEKNIASLGSNLLIVVPGAPQGAGGVRMAPGAWQSLKLGDAEAIQNEIEGISAVAPSQRDNDQLVANGQNWSTRIEGVTPSYLIARDWDVDKGRFFDEAEDRQARKVVVLGKTVADQLFPNVDPLGQMVRIKGGAYQVIGVMSSKGQSGVGQDQDDLVLIPLTTVKRRIAGRWRLPDAISQISIKAQSESTLSLVQDDVADLLRARHRTRDGEDDFTVQNLASISNVLADSTKTMDWLLMGIGAVSLLVGGIGIMNIMLVSVTERTREIGLRKALGARQSDIMHQFGLEAVTLSLAGGVIGLVLGAAGAWIITQAFQFPFVFAPVQAAIALVFAALVGVGFGAYPAWRAARLDPIEALRRE